MISHSCSNELSLFSSSKNSVANFFFFSIKAQLITTQESKITNNKSRQIITAGGKDEQVIEKSDWGHSAFTKNLLSGLSYKNADYNSDYIITASELGLYLSERVTIDSDGQQTPKFDRMSMDEGEFVFIINDRNMLTKDENIIAQLKADNAKLRMRLEQLESMQEQSPY